MSDDWYYTSGGKQFGPLPLSQLTQRLTQLPNWREEYVWRLGLDSWVPAATLQELSIKPPALPPPSPPLPSTPPVSAIDTKPKWSTFKKGVIAVGGFIMILLAASFGGLIGRHAVRAVMQPTQSDSDAAIRQGIIRAIQQTPLPKKIDEATTLTKMEQDGLSLHYFFVMDDQNFNIPTTFVQKQRPRVLKLACDSEMKAAMKIGARYEYHYRNTKGRDLGSFAVTHADCG